jgi:hypothetical protein
MQQIERQMEFFAKSEYELLKEDYNRIYNMCRGLFARNNELEKGYFELMSKVSELMQKVNGEEEQIGKIS